MIRRLIKKINLIGIAGNTDKEEINYINFTNVLIIINGLAIWFYIPYMFFYFPDSKIFVITVTLQFIFYTFALMCNYFRWHFLSRNILSFTALIFTTVEAVITNFYCDIHFFLLIGVIFAFFVFPERERKYSYFMAFCFAVSYLAIEFHIAYNGDHPLPPYYIMNLKHVIRACLLMLIFFFAYYSYTTIDKFHCEMKSESIRIEGEIELARNIQQQLIPSKNPDKNIYSFYKPMNRVGGDFYDFISFTDSDKIGIFLSDVSGHGVPAAFITTIIKTAIFQSGTAKEDPASLLMFLNNILIHHSGGNFVTAFYGIFSPSDRKLLFSNGGHNSPFIIDSSGVHELKGSKSKPLAILNNDQLIEKNQSYSNSEVFLEKDSKLLLYTDGLIETTSKKDPNLLFENAGLYNILADSQKLLCRDFITNIYNKLIKFNGSENFEDDICMICIDIV